MKRQWVGNRKKRSYTEIWGNTVLGEGKTATYTLEAELEMDASKTVKE